MRSPCPLVGQVPLVVSQHPCFGTRQMTDPTYSRGRSAGSFLPNNIAFGVFVPFVAMSASAEVMTTLHGHIFGVISRRAEEEVLGSHTRRGVAGMADQNAGRDLTFGKCVGNPMHSEVLPIDSDMSVSPSIWWSSPQPASGCLDDSRHQPFAQGFSQ